MVSALAGGVCVCVCHVSMVSSSLLYYSRASRGVIQEVYEPQIRVLLGTASYFCEVVVLKSRTVPIGTALSLRIRYSSEHGVQSLSQKSQ